MIDQNIKIAVESIRISLVSIIITLVAGIFPLILSFFDNNPFLLRKATIGVIVLSLFMALILFVLVIRLKVPKTNNSK